MAKRRVSIIDHGIFNMFGMNISLPAIIELEDDQIEIIKNTGLYHVAELNANQREQAKPTPLSEIEGDRFDRARTLSVNELAFKNPIMGTSFKNKAKNGVIVKKGSMLINRALKIDEKAQSNKSSVRNVTTNETSAAPAKLSNTVTNKTKPAKIENKEATMVKENATNLDVKHQI